MRRNEFGKLNIYCTTSDKIVILKKKWPSFKKRKTKQNEMIFRDDRSKLILGLRNLYFVLFVVHDGATTFYLKKKVNLIYRFFVEKRILQGNSQSLNHRYVVSIDHLN